VPQTGPATGHTVGAEDHGNKIQRRPPLLDISPRASPQASRQLGPLHRTCGAVWSSHGAWIGNRTEARQIGYGPVSERASTPLLKMLELAFAPEGQPESSPALPCRVGLEKRLRPVGTRGRGGRNRTRADTAIRRGGPLNLPPATHAFLPSRRDEALFTSFPGTEVPGYFPAAPSGAQRLNHPENGCNAFLPLRVTR
jgi:hypothetical protein